MTRTTPRFRMIGLWLVVCALALRLVIAPGFMSVAGPDGIMISMCTGQGAVTVHIPGKNDPAMPAHGGCAFASLAVADTPVVPVALTLPVLLAPVASLLIPLIRAPHVGAPAPPPPAIGPPALT